MDTMVLSTPSTFLGGVALHRSRDCGKSETQGATSKVQSFVSNSTDGNTSYQDLNNMCQGLY